LADYINPFIDEADTIIKANFNTRLAIISATLETIPDAQIFKSRQTFTQKTPMIHTFLAGDNEFVDQSITSHGMQVFWSFVTAVRYIDVQPSESSGNDVYSYTSALLETIYRGSTTAGKLDGVVDRIFPASHISVSVPVGDSMVYEEGIIWLIDDCIRPTA